MGMLRERSLFQQTAVIQTAVSQTTGEVISMLGRFSWSEQRDVRSARRRESRIPWLCHRMSKYFFFCRGLIESEVLERHMCVSILYMQQTR